MIEHPFAGQLIGETGGQDDHLPAVGQHAPAYFLNWGKRYLPGALLGKAKGKRYKLISKPLGRVETISTI